MNELIFAEGKCSECGSIIKGVNLSDLYDKAERHWHDEHFHEFSGFMFIESYDEIKANYFGKKAKKSRLTNSDSINL